MLTFTASRASSGNTLFPDKLEIDTVNVTYYKGNFFGYESSIIAISSIASVSMSSGIFFVDVIIETTGGKRVVANGFKKADAKSIVGLLTINRTTGGNINQSVYVNATASTTEQTLKQQNTQSISIKISAEKEILILSEKYPLLNLNKVIVNTNLEVEEAENALKNLVVKGLAKEENDSSGQSIYKFKNTLDYNVLLKTIDQSKKIAVIKTIREITGLGLKEAKDLVEGAPGYVKKGLQYNDAMKISEYIQISGGIVEIE
ncbi:MAG: ribosomal protein L7/L12 [Spirochaetaceae bacterium]|jgi:large subunit ribosomal protein L7/L12|nr:ribosomal protein L7/L12 [Spirochaetaceae bacterium]